MSNIIKKTLELNNLEYHAKHLEIINPVLPVQMTPREIEVLSAFMSLVGENAEEDRFGTFCRKKVKAICKLSNGGLANYLRSLKEKGFIMVDEAGLYIIPMILEPQHNLQQYEFKLINTEK